MDVLSDRVFDCPCCGEKLKVSIGVKVIEAVAYSDKPAPKGTKPLRTAVDTFADAEARKTGKQTKVTESPVVAAAEANGMLAAFAIAAERAFAAGGKPKDVGSVFLDFMVKARPKVIPQAALNIFTQQYEGNLEFWGALGILAIISNKTLRGFVPFNLVAGEPIKGLRGQLKARMDFDRNGLDNWVRGKFGYVAGRGEYFEAMRKRSIGDFANPVL